MNARSLVKPGACQALRANLSDHQVDLCVVFEAWLRTEVPSHLVTPNGYSMLRKDGPNRQGGSVAILCRNDWKLQKLTEFSNPFKCR